MNKVIIASLRRNAGKTSVIVGAAKALGERIGYMKPFGDRLLYQKKRLWDYDAALITNVFNLQDKPEDMTMGFDHSKLRYMYDEGSTKEKLQESISNVGKDKDILFIEGGRDITYGASVHLDAISLAQHVDGKLFIVLSGDEGTVMDDITFMKRHISMAQVDFGGVVVNKIHDVEDFRAIYYDSIAEMGIDVVGIIPYRAELTYLSLDYLAERLFAKVIAGEGGLNSAVKNIFIGAMPADAALRNPLFKRGNKLIITSGDRSDMILAALESDTSGIVLTNNVLPSSKIVSRAAERNIPLLLVPFDTYEAAKQIENLEPLLTKEDAEKIDLLKELITKHVELGEIAGS